MRTKLHIRTYAKCQVAGVFGGLPALCPSGQDRTRRKKSVFSSPAGRRVNPRSGALLCSDTLTPQKSENERCSARVLWPSSFRSIASTKNNGSYNAAVRPRCIVIRMLWNRGHKKLVKVSAAWTQLTPDERHARWGFHRWPCITSTAARGRRQCGDHAASRMGMVPPTLAAAAPLVRSSASRSTLLAVAAHACKPLLRSPAGR